MLNCPARESLELLLEERLGATETSLVELHVQHCTTCQGVLNELVSNSPDSYLPPPRSAAPGGAVDVELDGFFERLKQRALLLHGDDKETGKVDALPAVDGYDVLDELGRGAVGIVYRARHRELNRMVALKMIVAGPYLSPKARARFRIESQAIARLQHPNIVQVHDAGEQSGLLYLSLELVEGGSLAGLLAKGPRPSDEAARLVATLARAVEYAHQQGVIHRDLKPANVMLGRSKLAASTTSDRGTHANPLAEYELKITDFGLAKVAPGPGLADDGMTLSGEFLGTPRYTAPEQARGDTKEVGPEADVYALGAILYELLTGRPPFQAASAIETLLQVAHHEPVPPARLVPKIPRDLDTICLKCLEKDPLKRFASAAALADDLARFQDGEPIRARRVSRLERSVRWIRRRPEQAALIGGSTLVVIGLFFGGLVWSVKRATVVRAAGDDLRTFAMHERAANWVEARTALERAKVRLGDTGSSELHRLVDQGERDLALAALLDATRANRAELAVGNAGWKFDRAQSDREYETIFREAGLGSPDEDAEVVAARVSASNIKEALVAALDDWAVFGTEDKRAPRRAWLLEVARRADPDPTGWRDRVRDPATLDDPEAMRMLADTAPATDRSVSLLIALGEQAASKRDSAVDFLRRVQGDHPDDFWANFALANALIRTDLDAAIGYYRAAIAIRPQTLAAYSNLGKALLLSSRVDESIDVGRLALRIDPNSAAAHTNLGSSLHAGGRFEEALEEHCLALELDPQSVVAHIGMAESELQRGRGEDALPHALLAIQLEPRRSRSQYNLGLVLQTMGEVDLAVSAYEEALRIRPDDYLSHLNLGLILQSTERWDDAILHSEIAIHLQPKDANPRVNLGLALHQTGRIHEAIEQFRQAMHLDPKDARAVHDLARSLDALGRKNEAIEAYRRAAELDPTDSNPHSNLGAMLSRMGKLDEGIDELREAVRLRPADLNALGNLSVALLNRGEFEAARIVMDSWLALLPTNARSGQALAMSQHCDQMIALERRLPAVLEGMEKLTDGETCLHFADLCYAKQRFADAARLFAEAFALDPSLAEDPRSSNHYKAACAALLAACGRGTDATGFDEAQRSGWRDQARSWLRADWTAWTKLVERRNRKISSAAESTLMRWQEDPDFAAVREQRELVKLSAAERQEWRALWDDVELSIQRARAVK